MSEDWYLHPRIVVRKGRCGGRPTLDASRMPTASIAAFETVERVINAYPHLDKAGVLIALAFEAGRQYEREPVERECIDATRVTISAVQLARLRRIEAAAARFVEFVEATTEAARSARETLTTPPATHDRLIEIHARKALCAAVRS